MFTFVEGHLLLFNNDPPKGSRVSRLSPEVARQCHCERSEAISTRGTAIPAKAGIHRKSTALARLWIPAFAGMTVWDSLFTQPLSLLADHSFLTERHISRKDSLAKNPTTPERFLVQEFARMTGKVDSELVFHAGEIGFRTLDGPACQVDRRFRRDFRFADEGDEILNHTRDLFADNLVRYQVAVLGFSQYQWCEPCPVIGLQCL